LGRRLLNPRHYSGSTSAVGSGARNARQAWLATAADGGYLLTNLPLGPYRLEVAKEGFTKAVESGIELQVNADPAVDVALKVGAVTEQVNVEANAALVETRSSGVGAVIENQRILELPLNGRNTADLILLAGAA
jgi:hypothetical protein